MTQLQKSLQLLSFQPEELFDTLTENEKKEIYAWCSGVFKNSLFEKIFNEVYTKEVMDTIGNLENHDLALEGKGRLIGVAGVKELFKTYHLLHLESIKKEAPMTDEEKQEII